VLFRHTHRRQSHGNRRALSSRSKLQMWADVDGRIGLRIACSVLIVMHFEFIAQFPKHTQFPGDGRQFGGIFRWQCVQMMGCRFLLFVLGLLFVSVLRVTLLVRQRPRCIGEVGGEVIHRFASPPVPRWLRTNINDIVRGEDISGVVTLPPMIPQSFPSRIPPRVSLELSLELPLGIPL